MNRNVEIVKSMYASFLRGDVPAILEHLHPDIQWEHDSIDHGIPWLKPRRGRNDVPGFFAELAVIDIARFEPVSFLADENHVAVTIQLDCSVKKNGHRVSELELHLWTFDGSHRATHFRHYVDTHAYWLAAQA